LILNNLVDYQTLNGLIESMEKKFIVPATSMEPYSWIVSVRCKDFRSFSLIFSEDEVANRAVIILEQLAFPGWCKLTKFIRDYLTLACIS
jgi:hypothetical protein